jgi:hypothetical protein
MIARFMLATLLLIFVAITSVGAQQPPLKSPLLDHLAGKWVLRGTIAGQQTTHDVDADWVLDHHYLRVHEISREKDSTGKTKYEATIYIGWNPEPKHYAAVWLDVYGGLASESIGVANAENDRLPFIFKDEHGTVNLTNDFVYDPKTGTWEWRIDNVDKGVATPFARVKLTRN